MRGTKFASSPSGWVNSDAFIQWFLKHFRPHITKRPLVLLYDGHLQFISVRVLERAREDGVLLFPLPPHPAYNHCIENTCFHAFNVSIFTTFLCLSHRTKADMLLVSRAIRSGKRYPF